MFNSPFSLESGFLFRIFCFIFVVRYAVPCSEVAYFTRNKT